MSLRERLGITVAPAPKPSFPSAQEISQRFNRETNGKTPVRWSADLARILALPRRDLATTYTAKDVADLEAKLRKDPKGKCLCASLGRRCPVNLKPIQAYALLEAQRVGGLLGPIGVGHGKELITLLLPMVIPGTKTAVLMTQGNLRSQLVGSPDRPGDIDYYGAHWHLPYIVGSQWFRPGPALHIYSYDNLSRQSGTDLLNRIDPDLFICNEAHNLRRGKRGRPSTRTSRFLTFMEEHPKTRVCWLTGSMLKDSIQDYEHGARLALGEQNTPLPVQRMTLEEWASALDPNPEGVTPAGQLEKLAGPAAGGPEGETVREAFGRRRNDTPGVVASGAGALATSLVISVRPLQLPTETIDTKHPREPPRTLAEHIAQAHKGERPDGEQAKEALVSMGWARQLASGFFHRWRYPRGEEPELILEWLARRKANNKAIRGRLKDPEPHLDSPGLIENAARRFYTPREMKPPQDGRCPFCSAATSYPDPCVDCGEKVRPDPEMGLYAEGRALFSDAWEGAPVWAMPEWRAWSAIEDQVQPEPQAVWLSDFMVADAARWAAEAPGIVWVEYPELGERIARAAGIPYFGGGERASDEIRLEKGTRSVVASIKAHGTGKNLVAFARNLVCNPPANDEIWEQLIGRTHRDGQLADEVTVELYQHTQDYRDAFSKARELSAFTESVEKQQRKLCFATFL